MDVHNEASEHSLYTRLGGYLRIALIIDDIFDLMRADARFARFNAGRSIDARKRSQQLTVDQICALAGGPAPYTGRDMRTSHAGLGITASEWEANLELCRKALQKNQVGKREQAEFLSLIERFSSDIVESPACR